MDTFPQSLIISDMTTTRDGKTTDNTQFIDLYKLKVGSQQEKFFGTGSVLAGVDNRGVFYLSLKDNAGTPVQLEGKIRLSIRNANESRDIVILEEDTTRLRGSKTDLNQAYRLGIVSTGAKQDSYLIVQYKAKDSTTAGKTVSDANSDLVLPVTTFAQ